MDYTGTGNSLNVRHPHSLQLIMDSLRYWVLEMHVDGFRFDLASTLAREFYDVDQLSTLLRTRAAGPGGLPGQADRRAVGRRPRRLPGRQLSAAVDASGTASTATRCATSGAASRRRSASSPRASPARPTSTSTTGDGRWRRSTSSPPTTASRSPTSSSYNEKHNDANGEDNNDGESHNRSWNCGVEGPTDDAADPRLRARQQRNFLATLLLSQGVPMILHGDELGRTQQGNNNTYAQDTELLVDRLGRRPTPRLIEFVAAVTRLRREHPTFRRARFFDGRPVARGEGEPLPDIVWLATRRARRWSPSDWDTGFGRRRSACSSTATASTGTRPARRADHRPQLLAVLQRPRRARSSSSSCRPTSYAAAVGDRARHLRLPATAACSTPGASSTVQPKSLVVLRQSSQRRRTGSDRRRARAHRRCCAGTRATRGPPFRARG